MSSAKKSVLTATILSAASLSGEIPIGDAKALAIVMPAAWTAANLTFQGSDVKGGTYQDLYDDAGAEIVATVAAARTYVIGAVLKAIQNVSFIKIRSGTGAVPVVQVADRAILVIVTLNE